MESLIPLLIAAAISIVLSISNKKKKMNQTPVGDDPWGEVWRGLGLPDEENENLPKTVRESEEYQLEVAKPSEEYAIYEMAIPELEDMTPASDYYFAESNLSTSTISEMHHFQEDDTKDDDGASSFEEFDARMAIIYSEIMKPKHLD